MVWRTCCNPRELIRIRINSDHRERCGAHCHVGVVPEIDVGNGCKGISDQPLHVIYMLVQVRYKAVFVKSMVGVIVTNIE